MAFTDSITQKAGKLIGTVGKALLATQYPNDFEVYMCSLELTDSQDNTIDFFTFPIMPENISKTEPKRTSILNTAGGITVLTSPIFVPKEILIKGNFGRSFKILVSNGEGGILNGSAFSISAGARALYQIQGKNTSSLKTPDFDVNVKTGFGCIKILQAIIDKSNGVDSLGYPLRLYFYNMALGESYLITIPPGGINFSQSIQKNMIWDYTLNMSVIAPLEAVGRGKKAQTSLVNMCASSVIQKGVNDFASALSSNILGV